MVDPHGGSPMVDPPWWIPHENENENKNENKNDYGKILGRVSMHAYGVALHF